MGLVNNPVNSGDTWTDFGEITSFDYHEGSRYIYSKLVVTTSSGTDYLVTLDSSSSTCRDIVTGQNLFGDSKGNFKCEYKSSEERECA